MSACDIVMENGIILAWSDETVHRRMQDLYWLTIFNAFLEANRGRHMYFDKEKIRIYKKQPNFGSKIHGVLRYGEVKWKVQFESCKK